MRHDKHAGYILMFMAAFTFVVFQIGIPLMALQMQRQQIDFIITCPNEYPPLTLDQCWQITKER